MKTIGYIRVSSDQQDAEKQRHLLLDYAHCHQVVMQEFIRVELSTRQSSKARKIDLLCDTLTSGDQLLVAELSRLGRNMMETLALIEQLAQRDIKIIFVRQPELSTTGQHTKLLLAVYSYFAESERDFISVRTKQALAAVKAKGIKLGRPKGSKNKAGSALSPYREQIAQYLRYQLALSAIQKLINPLLGNPLSYNSFVYFVKHDSELSKIRNTQEESTR